MKGTKGFQNKLPERIKAAFEVTAGLITVDQYIKLHKNSGRYFWDDGPYLIQYPALFNEILRLLPYDHRVRLLINSFNLSQKIVKQMSIVSGSVLDDLLKRSENRHGADTLSKLAIALGVPLTSIISERLGVQFSFDEFYLAKCPTITFEELFKKISNPINDLSFDERKSLDNTGRVINGYILEHDPNIFQNESEDIFLRMDMKGEVTELGIYLKSNTIVDHKTVQAIIDLYKENINLVLLRPAVLRDCLKLDIICTTNPNSDSFKRFKENLSHFQRKEILWPNPLA